MKGAFVKVDSEAGLSAALDRGEKLWFKRHNVREVMPGNKVTDEFTHYTLVERRGSNGIYEGYTNLHARSVVPKRADWGPPHESPKRGTYFERKSFPWTALAEMSHVAEEEVDPFFSSIVTATRAASDERIGFGDGGRAVLVFPIFTIDNVLEEERRIRFLAALGDLAARRKDFQSEVVEVRSIGLDDCDPSAVFL